MNFPDRVAGARTFQNIRFARCTIKDDGNCQFYALAMILGMQPTRASVKELREIVASGVDALSDDDFNSFFDDHHEIWSHMTSQGPGGGRESVKEYYLTDKMWGDEFSLGLLEAHFKIALVLVDEDLKPHHQERYLRVGDVFEGGIQTFGLLKFHNVHYEPVAVVVPDPVDAYGGAGHKLRLSFEPHEYQVVLNALLEQSSVKAIQI